MAEIVTLTLSYPPSANSIWRNVKGRTLKSEAYRAWLNIAKGEVLIQRPGRVVGRYHMRLFLTPPDRRRRDLSNTLKATEDLLTQAGVIEDDHLAQSIHLEWNDITAPGGRVDISVRAA